MQQDIYRTIMFAAIAVWGPLFVGLFGYWYVRRLDSLRRERRQFHFEMLNEKQLQRQENDTERLRSEIIRENHLLRSYMESSFEDFGNVMKSSLSQTFQSLRSLNSELQRSLNSELQRSLNPELQRLLNSELQQNKRTDSSEKDDPGIVIKEIYHALATPLSLAEAGLLNADLQLSTATQTEMRERLITVLTGVQTCKAIMAGFREVILAAKSSGTWAPPSLHEIVLSVSKAVAEQMKKELKIVSTLPDSFKGYSNNYIVTAMLPLIENAIDAARPNSEILIQTRAGNVLFMIDVTSTPDATPVSDSIYKDGVTTKPGHSGTGLSIVQHLISGRPKSSLRHKVNGDNVIFTITLPVGE